METELFFATYCDSIKDVPIAKINGWILRLDTGEKMLFDNFTNLRKVKVVDETSIVIPQSYFDDAKISISVDSDGDKDLVFPARIADEIWKQVKKLTPPSPKTLLTREQRKKIYNSWTKTNLPYISVIQEHWQDGWIRAGYSPYAEDWQDVLEPKVTEPKNLGAIVEADTHYTNSRVKLELVSFSGENKWMLKFNGVIYFYQWSDLINPTVISEGIKE